MLPLFALFGPGPGAYGKQGGSGPPPKPPKSVTRADVLPNTRRAPSWAGLNFGSRLGDAFLATGRAANLGLGAAQSGVLRLQSFMDSQPTTRSTGRGSLRSVPSLGGWKYAPPAPAAASEPEAPGFFDKIFSKLGASGESALSGVLERGAGVFEEGIEDRLRKLAGLPTQREILKRIARRDDVAPSGPPQPTPSATATPAKVAPPVAGLPSAMANSGQIAGQSPGGGAAGGFSIGGLPKSWTMPLLIAGAVFLIMILMPSGGSRLGGRR